MGRRVFHSDNDEERGRERETCVMCECRASASATEMFRRLVLLKNSVAWVVR